ncbi:hypothetical protein F4802DRAFT_417388 [Xylaria palmicola]|nr:hypothetical protein F4802DRAFT_417388 [Xylaria palmicola]
MPNNMIGPPDASHGHGPVPPSPTLAFDVPDSNPDEIAILWEQVCPSRITSTSTRDSKTTTGSSRPRGRPSKKASSVPYSLPTVSEFNIASESSVSNMNPATNTKLTNITPHHPSFYDIVLKNYGIYIQTDGPIVPSAFAHFKTKKPANGYSSEAGLTSANAWVEKSERDLKRIAAEYVAMHGLDLSKEEYAMRAKEIFLLGPWRSDEVDLDRQWRADRMIQLFCPRNQKHWLPPPLLDGDEADHVKWTWDVRPDCAYWLSLKGFNLSYKFKVRKCTLVLAHKYITCPYFTIEFKKENTIGQVAESQVAAGGSLALFNRWRLYSEAREANPALGEDISNIKHYTLTFIGAVATIWILRPIIDDGQWKGCVMANLAMADCVDKYEVMELIDWINEIHRWGLSEHAPRCQRDVKAILDDAGVEVSILEPDEEQIE